MDEDRAIPCVSYAAKSTDDHHGSIAGQLAECRQAITRDELRELVGEYSDKAVSGYRRDRGPQLARALAHAERLAPSTARPSFGRSTPTGSRGMTGRRR
jgi:resolvase-like protein